MRRAKRCLGKLHLTDSRVANLRVATLRLANRRLANRRLANRRLGGLPVTYLSIKRERGQG